MPGSDRRFSIILSLQPEHRPSWTLGDRLLGNRQSNGIAAQPTSPVRSSGDSNHPDENLRWTIENLNNNPLYTTLGIHLTHMGEDEAVSVLRPGAAVCWPQPNQPHGGVLFTQLDTTMASAVLGGLDQGASLSTINADVQYLAPAQGPLFICSARVQRRGGKVSFVRAETRDNQDRLIALAQGSFRTFSTPAVTD